MLVGVIKQILMRTYEMLCIQSSTKDENCSVQQPQEKTPHLWSFFLNWWCLCQNYLQATVKCHIKANKTNIPPYTFSLQHTISVWKHLLAITIHLGKKKTTTYFSVLLLTMYSLWLRLCIPSWSLGLNFYSWIINPWK